MKLQVFFLSLFFCVQLSAQKDAVASLVDQLNTLNYWSYEDEVDIDSLVHATGSNLIQILEHQVLDQIDSLYNFSINSSDDGNLNWYTFFYYSGGTKGDVSNTVFQWKKSDKSYGAYGIYSANDKSKLSIEMNFHSSYKLPSKGKNLYLLLGNERGNSRLEVASALVVQLKNDYLILDYPAFKNNSAILYFFDYLETDSACIACMEYDEDNKLLMIDSFEEEDQLSISSEELEGRKGKIYFHFDGRNFKLK